MDAYLCVSFRFLDERYHGTAEGGENEWPPSPLRAFQALVCAAALRHGGRLPSGVEEAFGWLEEQGPPLVLAPPATAAEGYRLSVPSNSMDVVGKAWSKGNESNTGDASPATHRTMKRVRPMLLSGEVIHYLWRIHEPCHQDALSAADAVSLAAKDVCALGWGLDAAVGRGAIVAQEEIDSLEGERWIAAGTSANGLRTPVRGTLAAAKRRHAAFVQRTATGTLNPPAPLTVFDRVEYRRETDVASSPAAAFSLLQTDGERFCSFDTARQGLTVAGMLKGAVKAAAERAGWSDERIARFVLGHAEPKGGEHMPAGPARFVYLPLPSIERRGAGRPVAGRVRRVMLSGFSEDTGHEIEWARRSLSGEELIAAGSGDAIALISAIPHSDSVVVCYTRTAAEWATVTPVVLPGFDDPAHYRRRLQSGVTADEQKVLLGRLEQRVDGLLRRAIVQAGFSEALAKYAVLDWSKSSFWRGAEQADRYGIPDHLRRYPRFHVRIAWRDAVGRAIPVPGPICFGGGRYYGLGLFASE